MPVSVLMPAKNAERTLRLAVRSTLRALDDEDELLVGLHDSMDASSEILGEIRDHRLRVFTIRGGTFSEALNFLVAQSSPACHLIARMDADDICLPWRFKIQRRVALRFPNTFIFSTAIVLFRKSSVHLAMPQYLFRLYDSEIRELLTSVNPLNHPTMLVRKDVMTSLGGYRSVAGEDLELWLRAAMNDYKLFRLATPLIIYRLSSTQMSRSKEYIEGWSSSGEIQNLRDRLKERVGEEQTASWLSRVKISLQILGLPTPRKVYQLLRRS